MIFKTSDTEGNLNSGIEIDNAQDVTIPNGNLVVNRDNTSTFCEFGVVWVGFDGNTFDRASFGHIDNRSFNNYAIQQNPIGTTSINSAAGQQIFFRIQNLSEMQMSSTQFRPSTDNGLSLGAIGSKWNGVFLTRCAGTSATQLAIDANGCITSFSSDERVKKNVANLGDAATWTVIDALTPKTFEWKTNAELTTESDDNEDPALDGFYAKLMDDDFNQADETGTKYGFVAQDVESVLPDLVGQNNDVYELNMGHMMPFVIKALQDLKARIEVLEAA